MPWTKLEDHAEILAVHAAYMGFGQILYFGGDEFDAGHNERNEIDATRLFDCGSFAVERMPSPPFDTFCAGHAFIRSGNEVRLLVAGGTESHPEGGGHHDKHFPGLRDAALFNSPHFGDPGGAWFWTNAAPMNQGLLAGPAQLPPGAAPDPNRTGGRWYPTCLTLATGEVIAFGGHPGSHDQFHDNTIPEIFGRDPQPAGQWRRLAPYTNGAAVQYYGNYVMPLYPRVHLLPSGEILCSSPIGRQTVAFRPDVGPNGGTFTLVCLFPREINENYSWPNSPFNWSSVLLPLGLRRRDASDQWDPLPTRVLICGGTSPRPHVLDLTAWPGSPANWEKTGPRAIVKARVNGNATILPTGEILVTGGIDISEELLSRQVPPLDSLGTNEPEVYDPYSNTWTVLGSEPADVPRNYHSVALLMPDGRVWTAGSSRNSAGGIATRNTDIEIFEPWYHGDPGRPYITDAPSLAPAGQTITIKSTFADEIERVVVVRCGSCTHAFNSDQRLVELKFRHAGGDQLLVEMPAEPNIIPTGPYLIFTIRRKTGTLGLPSFGTDIHVVPDPQGHPVGASKGDHP